MNQNTRTYQQIFQFYQKIINVNVSDYEIERSKLTLPIIPMKILTSLCDQVTRIVSEEKMLIEFNEDVVVVGDLHGHILDLFRIIKKFGYPPATKYLFLGDLVDRGEFSTETTTVIFLMKVLWPESVIIIRGNHEFSQMWYQCGFASELSALYPTAYMGNEFQRAFSYLPLAALINGNIFCAHGGIGPKIQDINQVLDVNRPLFDFDYEPVLSLVWSDPVHANGFMNSTRGTGFFFGSDVLTTFLDNQHLDLFVRGHECVDGVVYCHNDRLVTVFSASNYCGMSTNKAGVLVIKKNGQRESVTFPPLRYIRRQTAAFVKSESETEFIVTMRSHALRIKAPRKSLPVLGSSSKEKLELQPPCIRQRELRPGASSVRRDKADRASVEFQKIPESPTCRRKSIDFGLSARRGTFDDESIPVDQSRNIQSQICFNIRQMKGDKNRHTLGGRKPPTVLTRPDTNNEQDPVGSPKRRYTIK